MILGILFGLLAAFCQSLSYLATRQYVHSRPDGGSRQLLVLAHVWMGVFSLMTLPLVWPAGGFAWGAIWEPLLSTSLFYLAGQFGLMIALKHAEPSRVSPLLGFKVVVLAGMTATLSPAHAPGEAALAPVGLTALQWAAAIVCVVAVVALNYSGAALRRRAWVGVLLACVCYSLSDWNITRLVRSIEFTLAPGTEHAHMIAALSAAALTYVVCGVIGVGFLPVKGSRRIVDWRDAAPFAVAWFVAMLFLYACFGLVGPLFGNILQSTRGLMSVAIGWLLIRTGLLHLEPLSGRGVLIKRAAAAALMFLAVTLYILGKPPDDTINGATSLPAAVTPAAPAR